MKIARGKTFMATIVIGLSICIPCLAWQKDPGLVGFDFDELIKTRQEIKKGAPTAKQPYLKLLKEADACLELPAEKVTDGDLPPSGDKHDFYAIGKYAWPNPAKPGGMPYIRIDCNINPEASGPRFDLARYNATVERVKVLSLAWFYSQDKKYSDRAAELLRVWFLDEETKMNPNFECASALPGVHKGMAIGIIFGVTLVEMVDHIKLLTLSESWTDADNKALQRWFSEYIEWLVASDFGKEEKRARNNHGTWYSAQIAAYALYAGDKARAREFVEFGKQQIDEQMASDGGFPHELKRDWAFSYSVYGLRAFTALALCGDHAGVDLWNYETADGRGLRKAYGFLSPYLANEKKWTRGIVREGEPTSLIAMPMMNWAARKYDDEFIKKAADCLKSTFGASLRHGWI